MAKKVLTATADPLKGSVIVGATEGVPNGLLTLTRSENGVVQLVRNGEGHVSTGGFVREDPEAAFGIPLLYRASVVVDNRHIQSNRVLNPKAKNNTTGWTAGPGRTLTRETGAPLVPPRDATTSLKASPFTAGATTGSLPDRMLAAVAPSGLATGRWFVSGQVRLDSPDLWLWEDVKAAGTWQQVKNIGTWQQVKTKTSEAANLPFATFWGAVAGPTDTTVEVARNLATDPRATTATGPSGTSQAGWSNTRSFGTGGAGTHTALTGQTGPVTGLTTALRKTWTTASSTAAETGFGMNSQFRAIAVTPGQSYTASGFLRPSVAGKLGRGVIYWVDAAGAILAGAAQRSNGTEVALASGQWTRASVTAVAPAGAAWAYPCIDVSSGTAWAVNATLDGTGLLIEQSDSLGGYFDGVSTAANAVTYAWTGTANASASVKRTTGPTLLTTPIQLLGVAASAGSDWRTFQAYLDVPAGAPAGSRVVFFHGPQPREYATDWWLTTVMVTPSSEIGPGSLNYFDGDSILPTNPADNMVSGFDWNPATEDASFTWNGTPNASVSIFTGPSVITTTTTITIGRPTELELPAYKLPVFLSDPVSPALGQWFELVRIGELNWAARQDLYNILGKGPQVAVSQIRSWASGELTLMTKTLEEAENAELLFASGRILFWRNPDPRFPENGWYVGIGNTKAARPSDVAAWAPERLWTIPWVRVERPAGLIEASQVLALP